MDKKIEAPKPKPLLCPTLPDPPPIPPKLLDPSQLAEVCWGLINEAVKRGEVKVPEGGVMQLEPDQYVRLLQWVATVKIKKPKAVSKPEDFRPKETRIR